MIGQTISHYHILEKLGEGGMGVVYKAEDTNLKRQVAIKFLPHQISAGEEDRERFKIEARAAAALDHSNICTVHEIDEAEGNFFIVMAYIDGQNLKEKIAGIGSKSPSPLPIDEALDIAGQIAEGLREAHEKGIVHRDIKSANIMITTKSQVKITDFGLAKLSGHTRLTKTGTTVGTAAYMSPEQARGEDVDFRTDIWSFGVILYEMLTGQLPFKGDYEQAIMYSILNEEPEPLTGLRTGVPMELERIVNKALTKNPAERYQGLADFLVDIRGIRQTLISKIPKSQIEKKEISETKDSSLRSRFIHHRKGLSIVFALIAVIVLVVFFLRNQIFLNPADSERYDLAILPLIDPSAALPLNAPGRELRRQLVQLGSHTRILPFEDLNEIYGEKITENSKAQFEKILNYISSGSTHTLRWEINRLGPIPMLSMDLVLRSTGAIQQTLEYPLPEETTLAALLEDRLVRDLEAFFFSFRSEVTFPTGHEQQRPSPITWSAEAASLYVESLELSHKGRMWETLGLINRALEIDPEFAQAYGQRSYIIFNLSLPYIGPALSLPDITLALTLKNRLEPWEVELHKRAQQYISGSSGLVIQSLEESIISKLGIYRRLHTQVSILIFQGRSEELLDYSLQMLEKYPESYLLWLSGPMNVMDLGYSSEKILATLAPLFEAHPDNPMLHLTLGTCLIGFQKSVEKAETEFALTHKLIGGHWQPRYAWLAGKMEYYAGRYERAEEILLEALNTSTTPGRFRPDSRLQEMRGISHESNDPRLYAFLISSYRNMNRLADAHKYVDIYRRILPENPWIDYESGRVYAASGELETAIEEFGRCIVKDSTYLWAYYRRGNVLISLGRPDEAVKDLERFVDLMGPEGADVKSVQEAQRIIKNIRKEG